MSDNDLILFTNPMSRGRIARWMLEETGVHYDTEIIFFGEGMKSAGYRAINPMGKVPALRHGTRTVTECPAICAYLADAFPEAGLAPAPSDRADYYRWLFFAAGPLETAVTLKAFCVELTEQQQRTAGCGSYADVIDTLEKAITAHDFVAGPRFTAADVYVGSHVGWGMRFGSIEERPAFKTYWERVSDRRAYRKATEIDDTLTPDQQ
jgi:glutathione S-transferase